MRKLSVVSARLRVATVGLVAAVLLFAVAAWGAARVDGVPNAIAPQIEVKPGAMGSYRPALVSELDRAVDRDPFHPERRRPQIRYELPGSRPVVDPEAGKPIAEPIQLIGTVVAAGGRSFAMCQTSAGPQLVHIGETFSGHTLKSVEQGSAVFVSPQGKVLNVRVKNPGS